MTGTDGADALTGLVQASDGFFYGATSVGGAHNLGVVFRVAAGGQYSVLYSFTGGSDGSNPVGSLLLGSDGNLYGSTEFGGDPNLCGSTGGCGTIFQLSLSGDLKTIHNFAGAAEGSHPQSGLVEDSQGVLYGTAAYGGDANSDGTVYKITKAGAFTVLHAFGGNNDGAQPVSNLIQASDGRFYGAAQDGGADGFGTLFSISSEGDFALLHTFTGSDGEAPGGDLFQASNGELYGTTVRGGDLSKCSSVGCGTLFQLTTAGNFSPLYRFSDSGDGAHPISGLFQADDLYLYGTTTGAGNCVTDSGKAGCGTIFRLSVSGTLETVFQSTTVSDRVASNGFLLEGADGSLYGTTPGSPSISRGNASATVYQFNGGDKNQGAVQLSFDRSLVAPGTTVTLRWQVLNAGSLSFKQCYANIQDSPSGAGTWAGSQTGSFVDNVYSGSASITPMQDGTYTYALTCGGVQTGFATLTVGTPAPLRITTQTLPAGILGTSYSTTLSSSGGYGNKTWTLSSGLLPTGLTLTQNGMLSGVPSAAGVFNFIIQVSDEQEPSAKATQSLSLVVQQRTPSVTLSANPSSISTNQTTSLTATVQGIENEAAPSGSVQFQINGSSVGSSVTIVNGAASFTTPPFMARGSYRLTVIYSGDANYTSATSPVVALQVLAPSPKVTATVSPGEIVAGGTVTLNANVATLSGLGTPTGTIQFQANGNNIGAPIALNGGIAKLADQVFSAPGTFAVHAVYSGDANYSATSSAEVTLIVDSASPRLAIAPGQLTLSPQGASGSVSLQVSRFSSENVAFTVSGLPVNTAYTVGSLNGNGNAGTAALHIQSSAPYHSELSPIRQDETVAPLYAVAFPGLFCLLGVRRKNKVDSSAKALLMLGALVACTFLSGCGVQFNGTPVGTYTVTVNASGGDQSASSTFRLVVSKSQEP